MVYSAPCGISSDAAWSNAEFSEPRLRLPDRPKSFVTVASDETLAAFTG